jgi:hypothetical protein
MGTSRLNPRNTRKIARATGLNVIMAWSGGGYDLGFVTSDHVHGVFHKKDETWEVFDKDPDKLGNHMTSCRELFPDDFDDV